MPEITMTTQEAADFLSQPDVKIGLLGWIEARCQVKTVQVEQGEPYYKTPEAKRVTRDKVEGGKSVDEVLPNGIHRFVCVSIQSVKNHRDAVNNARERAGLEADYPERPHSWAVRYNGSPLVYQHQDEDKRNGKFYLQVRINQKSCVKSTATLRDDNGDPLDAEKVWRVLATAELPDKRKAKRKAEAAAQGLDEENAVFCRDFTLNNVERFCYCGQVYRINDEPADTGQTVEAVAPAPVPVNA